MSPKPCWLKALSPRKVQRWSFGEETEPQDSDLINESTYWWVHNLICYCWVMNIHEAGSSWRKRVFGGVNLPPGPSSLLLCHPKSCFVPSPIRLHLDVLPYHKFIDRAKWSWFEAFEHKPRWTFPNSKFLSGAFCHNDDRRTNMFAFLHRDTVPSDIK